MATEAEPLEQNWYVDRRRRRHFVVLDVDAEQGVIYIQDFDGDSDEMTLDEWYALDLEPAEPPEDYEGSMSNEDDEDHAFGYTGGSTDDGREPPGGPPRGRDTDWARPHGYPGRGRT